jgi:hypothetical protein
MRRTHPFSSKVVQTADLSDNRIYQTHQSEKSRRTIDAAILNGYLVLFLS